MVRREKEIKYASSLHHVLVMSTKSDAEKTMNSVSAQKRLALIFSLLRRVIHGLFTLRGIALTPLLLRIYR
jgi:CRISPR/Cas system type I-B associated protein Csh2 (Cas7 group RAMP superfamily)